LIAVRGPGVPGHLRDRGDRQEVMLGYSIRRGRAGSWRELALYRAQEALVASARRHGVTLTLFHGRGARSGGRRAG
jgi:phosphoenolpyruvate carboxylase